MASASSTLFPSFERSISLNDLDSALNMRELVERDVVVPGDASQRFLEEMPQQSFFLPNFEQIETSDYRKFLYSSLVDMEILRELENVNILNWCKDVHPMVPLQTIGDGNCLMHAASLAMWAVNDRYQILRRSVHQSLLEDAQGTYHQRWQQEQEQIKQRFLGGYELTEDQWKEEWQQIIQLVSTAEFPSGRKGAQYGSLEEVHIFVLANVLRRTIIVLCDETLRGNYGESFSPVNFGGIYLPLKWDPLDCIKTPLVIGYAQGHFTAIVSLKDGKLDLGSHSFADAGNPAIKHAVPLVKPDGSPLPVHFLLGGEQGQESGLLRQYLDCAKIPVGQQASSQSHGSGTILAAKLTFTPPPPAMERLAESFLHHASVMYKHMVRQQQAQPAAPPLHLPSNPEPCRTAGCKFFGRSENAGLCSGCIPKFLANQSSLEEPAVASGTGLPGPPLQPPHPVPQQQKPGPSCTTQSPAVAPQPSAGFQTPCHTRGCKYPATPGRGGFCVRCYEAERSAEEMAASVEYQLMHGEPCANKQNGCEYFGTRQHHNLCSRCYRHFCVILENRHVEQAPMSPGVVQGTTPTPGNPCQGTNCRAEGLAALYNMCLRCYTACIKAFISSEGTTIGSTVVPQPGLPSGGLDAKPVAVKKGILCASPGCFSERVPNHNDLCGDCYRASKGPSRVPMAASVGTAQAGAVASGTSGTPPGGAAVNLPHAMGQKVYCSNGKCMAFPGRNTGELCPPCYQAQAGPSPNPTSAASVTSTSPSVPTTSHGSQGQSSSMQHALLHSQRSVPGSAIPSQSSPSIARTEAEVTVCITPNCQSPGSPSRHFLCRQCYDEEVAEWNRIGGVSGAASSAGLQQAVRNPTAPCVMEGCRKPSVPELNQLCRPCYQAAINHEKQYAFRQEREQQARSQVNLNESRRPASPPHPKKAVFPAPTPCKTVGCLSFGTSQTNGLCEICLSHDQAQASGNSQAGETQTGASATPQPAQPVPGLQRSKVPVQVASRSSWATATPQDVISGQRCKRPMCTMFGTSELGGLCSKCFAEKTMVSAYPNSVPDAPPSSPTTPAPGTVNRCAVPIGGQRECLNAGCTNLANPHLHNHCTDCFRGLYHELAQRQEYRDWFGQ